MGYGRNVRANGGGAERDYVVVPRKDTSTGISRAIAQVVATGLPGAVRLLHDRTYDMIEGGPVTMAPGVSIFGTPVVTQILSNVAENTWTFAGGTVLQGDGTFPAFVYHNTLRVNTAFTSVSNADNGGFLQLSSAGTHLLTSKSVGRTLYCSWSGGAGNPPAGYYALKSVESTTAFTLNYSSTGFASMGTPSPQMLLNSITVDGFLSDSLRNMAISGIAFDNFTRAIDIGSVNNAGLFNCDIKDVWFRRCSEWGLNLENFQYCRFQRIRGWTNVNSQNGGLRCVSSVPSSILYPGDSYFKDISHRMAYRLNRGIVFETASGAQLNDIEVTRSHVNRGGEAKASVTATFTTSSANVGVPDSTLFPVGMPVSFTATGNGIAAANYTYFVVSSAANVLQLANEPNGTPITWTGNTSKTMECGGFPDWEITTTDGAVFSHQNYRFKSIGAEAINNTCFLFSMLKASELHFIGLTPGAINVLVGRSATGVKVDANCLTSGFSVDLDSNASATRIDGDVHTIRLYSGYGVRKGGAYLSYGFPTLTVGAALGSTGTMIRTDARAVNGQIKFTPGGSGIGAGTLGTISALFNSTVAKYPVITPANAAANALAGADKVRVGTSDTTSFTFVTDGTLVSGTEYIFNYYC